MRRLVHRPGLRPAVLWLPRPVPAMAMGVLVLALGLVTAPVARGAENHREPYRAAREAIDRGDWLRAASLLEQAIVHQPRAEGTVRLYGNRVVPYLPHYYLGLARKALDDCAAAIAAFDRAAAEGTIGDYRKLARSLDTNRAACVESLPPAPPPPNPSNASHSDVTRPAEAREPPASSGEILEVPAPPPPWPEPAIRAGERADDEESSTTGAEATSAGNPDTERLPSVPARGDQPMNGLIVDRADSSSADERSEDRVATGTNPPESATHDTSAQDTAGDHRATQEATEHDDSQGTSVAENPAGTRPEPVAAVPRTPPPTAPSDSPGDQRGLIHATEAFLAGRLELAQSILDVRLSASGMSVTEASGAALTSGEEPSASRERAAALVLRASVRYARWVDGGEADAALLARATEDLCAIPEAASVDLAQVSNLSPRFRALARALECAPGTKRATKAVGDR